MLKELVKLADYLDSMGKKDEADSVDQMIAKLAIVFPDPEPSSHYPRGPMDAPDPWDRGKEFPRDPRQDLWDEPYDYTPPAELSPDDTPTVEYETGETPSATGEVGDQLVREDLKGPFERGQYARETGTHLGDIVSNLHPTKGDAAYQSIMSLFTGMVKGEAFSGAKDIDNTIAVIKEAGYDSERLRHAIRMAMTYLGAVTDFKDLFQKARKGREELVEWKPTRESVSEENIRLMQEQGVSGKHTIHEEGATTFDEFSQITLDNLIWVANILFQDFQKA